MNIDGIIENAYSVVENHRISCGKYARWIWQDEKESRNLGINEYGCADAANILYTIGRFPSKNEERDLWVEALSDMQNKDTGLFEEATHHPFHTTAHCIAALELFEAKPRYKLTEMEKYLDFDKLEKLLDGLNWDEDPWDSSHQGAGIFAAMVISETAGSDWQDVYFKWLWENADPETGLWRRGAVGKGLAPKFHHLVGTFHYLFNHEHARMPLHYPKKLIDTCIDLYKQKGLNGDRFGRQLGFLEVDWVYCLTRALRQSGHRYDEAVAVLKDFATGYVEFLNGIDIKTHDQFNDLHALFGTMCCLAELQTALPGYLKSKKPLKLVLDRRAFI